MWKATYFSIIDLNIKKYNYYKLKITEIDYTKNEETYINEFKNIFFNVIESQLRAPNKEISSALSGGLDSTSLSFLIEKINKKYNLHPISIKFNEVDEIKIKSNDNLFIDLCSPSFQDHHVLELENIGPLSNIKKNQEKSVAPISAINGFIHEEMFRKSQSLGSRVFFDGFDGDTTISHGYEKLFDYALKLNFKNLFSERKKIDKRFDVKFSYLKTIKTYLIKPKIPSLVNFIISYLKNRNKYPYNFFQLVNINGFKIFIYLKKLYGYFPYKYHPPSQRYYLNSINNPIWEHAFEIIESVAVKNNVEVRFPYFDIRIIEFCMKCPVSLKNKDGLNRYLLRKAMEDILPKDIYSRVSKADISFLANKQLSKINLYNLEKDILRHEELKNLINLKYFKNQFKDSINNKSDNSLYMLYSLISLVTWLDHIKNKI